MIFEKPTAAHKQQALAFLQSFYDAGERTVNGSGGLDFYPTYEEWLAYLAAIEAGREEGFVPSHVYFARLEGGPDAGIAGVLDIRPTLPEEKWHFGHIGYSTAPAFRRKGVALAMLNWGTETLHSGGVETVIGCCYEGNAPSKAVLTKGGYVQAQTYAEEETGKTVLVFHHAR